MRAAAIAMLLLTPSSLPALAGQELIERTLALVAGQVVTLTDVQGALALGLLEGVDPEDIANATERLIERVLMLREIQNYAPPEPPAAAIVRQTETVQARFATPDTLVRALDRSGFTEARLQAWVRDDLRITAYLDGRFAAAEEASDQDVAAYYQDHRAELERAGLALAAAAPLIKQRIGDTRRRALVADWLADLKRRVEVRRIGK